MSRATVRAGIATWLTGQVPGINTVYRGQRRIIPATAFTKGQVGAPFGAVAMVHILNEAENRIAVGGAQAGWKRLDYQVEIQLFFRWTSPARSANTDSDSGLEATDAFDAIVDALKARIRADRTAGGTVWQWGEKRLTGRYGELVERGDALELWAGIATEVTEMLPT